MAYLHQGQKRTKETQEAAHYSVRTRLGNGHKDPFLDEGRWRQKKLFINMTRR